MRKLCPENVRFSAPTNKTELRRNYAETMSKNVSKCCKNLDELDTLKKARNRKSNETETRRILLNNSDGTVMEQREMQRICRERMSD
jgi:hypothetical protein